ncbi:Putative peptidoglycan binding domain-containing protein [Thermosyntropha lipolytica DSM 11003]|uniref:Putative peptidoglycan binding domain-containing protein n=1 Tax=Thermosyntropha lipolytica DSM 11003 TaxID=1123382 RepID=A0A1M5N166_9FIRM|nr:peptidoglycan-binding protein [Thermosyntropha lipolytica]SHG82919.1 Putative peptidoglycan binding domain-containing protein [Thermosyntropha lipolytica DSM 11003]
MRKEYIVFFSLILAAAITAGSTLSLAANAQALAKYSTAQPQTEKTTSPAEEEDKTSSLKQEEKKEEISSSYFHKDNANNPQISYIYIADRNKPVNLTEEQKKEVISLLKELGMQNEEEYTSFLQEFQQQRNLPPTGQLDTFTLELIINQVQIERALAQIRAAHRR